MMSCCFTWSRVYDRCQVVLKEVWFVIQSHDWQEVWCAPLVKKKYIHLKWVVEEQARLGTSYHIIQLRLYRTLCCTCYTHTVTVNWPINHLVTLHISFNLTFYHIGEKRSTLICQPQVFHADNFPHIRCIMIHFNVNDQCLYFFYVFVVLNQILCQSVVDG